MKTLKEKINSDFMVAFKNKEMDKKNFLGLIKGEIQLQEARGIESIDKNVLVILKRLEKSLIQNGDENSKKELEYLSPYMPKMMSEDEIRNIIINLKNTQNISFEFEQNINEKIEKGNCVLEYPKKIFCEYLGNNNKILVSNGKSLVIKTKASYYRYPLEKTVLNFILDKDFLINKIYNLEERIIDESFINYKIEENNNEINIFFDNQTFNLIGWQTKDIYQNFNMTFLSSVKKNESINKNIFKLHLRN